MASPPHACPARAGCPTSPCHSPRRRCHRRNGRVNALNTLARRFGARRQVKVSARFTETRRRTSWLREVVEGNCVDAFRCASARAAGIYFQACSSNHSDRELCQTSSCAAITCGHMEFLRPLRPWLSERRLCVFCGSIYLLADTISHRLQRAPAGDYSGVGTGTSTTR